MDRFTVEYHITAETPTDLSQDELRLLDRVDIPLDHICEVCQAVGLTATLRTSAGALVGRVRVDGTAVLHEKPSH